MADDEKRKLEKYELLDELGHGGMATVYRARDTRLDRLVALKVLHPHLRTAPEARTRFTREARSVAKLRHPHILEVYDYSGEDSEQSYIAAELLTGPTLEALVAEGPLPAEIAACIGVQIGRALSAAHESGIIHRDVKPGNVLVHDGKLVKLTDFGIAQMVDSQSFTATGQILGSPGHMAPEQIEGGAIDVRTDVFALGTVLYHLGTARLPFAGRNPHQMLKRIVDGDYADPLRVNPRLGAGFAAIVRRAMATRPDDRYPTAQALVEALESFVAEIGIDDPDAALEAFFADPTGETARLERLAVERLEARGKELAAAGDVPGALARFDRALALDDGNEAVLRAVEELGRRRRWESLLPRAGLTALVLVGVAALGWVYLGPAASGSVRDGGVEAVVATDGGSADGNGADAPTGDAQVPSQDAGSALTLDAALDGAALDAAAVDGAASDGAPLQGATKVRPPQLVQRVPRLNRPRVVVFDPSPQRVRIGVDGAPPRPYGPGFQRVELRPGPHHFVFRGPGHCCVDADFTVNIPPGRAPFRLERVLRFNSARVLIRTDVPARVRVAEGSGPPATGVANEIFEVPMGAIEERRQFTVTAPGRPVYTGTLRLTAGSLAPALRVELGAGPGD